MSTPPAAAVAPVVSSEMPVLNYVTKKITYQGHTFALFMDGKLVDDSRLVEKVFNQLKREHENTDLAQKIGAPVVSAASGLRIIFGEKSVKVCTDANRNGEEVSLLQGKKRADVDARRTKFLTGFDAVRGMVEGVTGKRNIDEEWKIKKEELNRVEEKDEFGKLKTLSGKLKSAIDKLKKPLLEKKSEVDEEQLKKLRIFLAYAREEEQKRAEEEKEAKAAAAAAAPAPAAAAPSSAASASVPAPAGASTSDSSPAAPSTAAAPAPAPAAADALGGK